MTEEDEFCELMSREIDPGWARGIDWYRLIIWAVTIVFCAAVLGAIVWPLIAMVMT